MPIGNDYTTEQLLETLEIIRPEAFYGLQIFTNQVSFDTQEIRFDEVDEGRRIAAYCSPLAEGDIYEKTGFTTKSFRPAYVKPKQAIRPDEVLPRAAGELSGGSLSLPQKMDAAVARQLVIQDRMIMRREEAMIWEILRTGQVTVVGPKYPISVVNYARHADLNFAAPAPWTTTGQDPLAQIEALAERSGSLGGSPVRLVVMNSTTWSGFAANEQVGAFLKDLRRGTNISINVDPVNRVGARFKGSHGDFEFWTYDDKYENEAKAEIKYIPDGEVILFDPESARLTMTHGAVLDVDSLVATSRFPKMWKQEDPSGMYMMTQSAPLPVPVNINCTARITGAI